MIHILAGHCRIWACSDCAKDCPSCAEAFFAALASVAPPFPPSLHSCLGAVMEGLGSQLTLDRTLSQILDCFSVAFEVLIRDRVWLDEGPPRRSCAPP